MKPCVLTRGFSVGDCVSVTGRFRRSLRTPGEVVIMANHVQKVDNPNVEIDRILMLAGDSSIIS